MAIHSVLENTDASARPKKGLFLELQYATPELSLLSRHRAMHTKRSIISAWDHSSRLVALVTLICANRIAAQRRSSYSTWDVIDAKQCNTSGALGG